MIKEIKLKAVYINTTNKDGATLVDKNGNAYSRVAIESESGHKASMFCGKYGAKDLEIVKTWKAGDTVRITLEQKGEYLNFSIPSKTDELTERVEKLERALFGPVAEKEGQDSQSPSVAVKTPVMAKFDLIESPGEVTLDQIPF